MTFETLKYLRQRLTDHIFERLAVLVDVPGRLVDGEGLVLVGQVRAEQLQGGGVGVHLESTLENIQIVNKQI